MADTILGDCYEIKKASWSPLFYACVTSEIQLKLDSIWADNCNTIIYLHRTRTNLC